ncbi:MAG: hypothetical protein HQM06_12910 [Magnetococcales bacterium]|nr:hypothetical protein [Magnetococcales bacterium]
MAVLILLALALLGSTLGRLHLRSLDLAQEWINKPGFVARTLDQLLELGKRGAYDRFNNLCDLPVENSFTWQIPGWGSVTARIEPLDSDNTYPIKVEANQSGKSRTLNCRNACRKQNTSDPTTTPQVSAITISCPPL